jgi:hypothetical protein
MPTEPLKSVLYREFSKVSAEQIVPNASPLLQEMINYSTNALVRCATSASGNRDEDTAILALYRHIIEMIDGVEVLISQACSVPTVPLLRSAFEALLSIQYILETEQDYGRRALAWLVGYIHKRLDMYERLDPTTSQGQKARKLIEDDEIASNVLLPPPKDLQRFGANLRDLLSEPHLQPIEAEFQRCQKEHSRTKINWYHLFNGPSSLYELAERLGRGGQYETLYRSWSTTTHAQDLLPFIAQTPEGEATMGGLRDPNLVKEAVRFAAPILLEATKRILKKLRPGEDSFDRWYKQEVLALYLSVMKSTG